MADRIFSMIHYFTLVRLIMASFFPEAVSLGAEVNVSMKRIEVCTDRFDVEISIEGDRFGSSFLQNFLLLEEIVPDVKRPDVEDDGLVISMKDVSASWEKQVDNLCDINVSVPLNKLWAVVGPVGSGKVKRKRYIYFVGMDFFKNLIDEPRIFRALF